jgi:hypothetical protein
MKIDIDQLTETELIELHHRIVERLRFLEQMRSHGAMLKFSIGERVTFSPTGRDPVIGMIVKYNKRTVTVVTDDGHRWNVSPNFLKKVELKDITPNERNVIQIKEFRK